MSKKKLLYIFTFIVAFCSIAYELALGQALSLFLGNTILRFSVTIGIYMFAMGVGAMIAEGKMMKDKLRMFMLVEMWLVILGGFSTILLFLTQSILGSGGLFLAFALALIFAIGVFTGFEIPLLMELLAEENKEKNSDSKVLGVDYLGAFAGSIVFAIFFYPKLGLLQTTFSIAFLNCVVSILFYLKWRNKKQEKKATKNIFRFQMFLFFVLIYLLSNSQKLTDSMIDLYLK